MNAKTNSLVFIFLNVIAWIIFVGLSIEAAALVVNFAFSLFKPEVVSNLYQKLDMSVMYNESRVSYFSMYSFILAVAILKAYLFYVVIRLLMKLDLTRPFNSFVAQQITSISYYTLMIGFLGALAKAVSKGLEKRGIETSHLDHFWADSSAFIFMGAVIYVIANIFRRGMEIQNENDLTI